VVELSMAGKIIGFIREAKMGLSIILVVVGLIVFLLSLTHYVLQDFEPEFIKNTVGNWNAFLIPIGLIVLGFGIYYLYIYIKNKKFILEELETNKRSELLKRHTEIKNTVRHMPKKYQKMVREKEKELKIK
jgi:nitrogen fixation-related uncharacterized protein